MTLLRTIFNRSPLLLKTIRGGHGWERPDVPLSKLYVHKRRHRVEDIHTTWTDAVQPEYILSQPQIFLGSMKEGLPRLFANWGMLFTGFAVIGIMLQIFVSHSYLSMDDKIFEEKKLSDRIARQRIMHKHLMNNPFGIEVSTDNGDRQYEYGMTELALKSIEIKKKFIKVDEQVKAYVAKKTIEAEQEIKKEESEGKTKQHSNKAKHH